MELSRETENLWLSRETEKPAFVPEMEKLQWPGGFEKTLWEKKGKELSDAIIYGKTG